jgi:hypothetical protein
VIGGQAGADERTVQYEGAVDSPTGAELETWKQAYFARHPDAPRRSQLPGITYYRVRPRWVRYTNFNASPAQVVVFEGAALQAQPQARGTAAPAHFVQQSSPWQPNIDRGAEFNAFTNSSRKK